MEPRRRTGCLKVLFWFAVVDCVILFVIGDTFYNLSSNLVLWAFKDSKAPLEVKTKRGWRPIAEATVAEMGEALVERHSEDEFRWSALPVRRHGTTVFQRVIGAMFGSEMNIISISPYRFQFMTSYQSSFASTTAKERMNTDDLTFSIVANFHDPKGKPLGFVFHNGQQLTPAFKAWTGVFFTKGGRPYFGPKSLLDEVPGDIEEGTQGYPSVMKDGVVFSYVNQAPDKFFDGKKITYRSLAGTRKDGTVVFVLSGDGGALNVTEVTEIAKKLALQHATLLDGGRALQYSIRTSGGQRHFSAFNTTLDFGPRVIRPQKSPVFIGVKPRN